MTKKRENPPGPPAVSQSEQRRVDATCRRIATYFCGKCTAKILSIDDGNYVVFKLKMPELKAMKTPPLPVKGNIKPDPIEFFVKQLYLKPVQRRKKSK